MKSVILASHNVGKLHEFQKLASDFPFTLHMPPDDLPDVDETASTFVENALLKARSAALHTGLPALADDSGLVVPYLQGAPGIYSSRYSGPDANAQKNIQKLLAELRDVPPEQRTAFFYCCLVLVKQADDPIPIIAEGFWHGTILTEARGTKGFGYDPVFYIADKNSSAGELEPDVKDRMSHRAFAVKELMNKISYSFSTLP